MIIKGNQFEIVKSVMGEEAEAADLETVKRCCVNINRNNNKPLVVTLGEQGALVVSNGEVTHIPAQQVRGQIDVCGAGDAFTASFIGALAAGATPGKPRISAIRRRRFA